MCKQPAVRMFKLEWQRRLTWLCRTANAVCLYTAKCIYDSMEQKCHLVVKVSPNIWSTNFYITHTSSLVHDQKFSSTNLLLASWVKKKWQQVGKFCSPWQDLYCTAKKLQPSSFYLNKWTSWWFHHWQLKTIEFDTAVYSYKNMEM